MENHGMVNPSEVLDPQETYSKDLESSQGLTRHLTNESVHHFAWSDVGVVVKDRRTKQPLHILTSSYGHVEAGQVLALLGPSGSGKTTLLNVLAYRLAATKSEVQGKVMVDGQLLSQERLRKLSSYVEQEDALIGSLTVKETIIFAARLSLGNSISTKERRMRVNALVDSFGLNRQTDTIVGTPLRKGISGGQKRRLSVAAQLVTSPSILFLDEPTSGLDSAASHEVMSYISTVAKEHHIIVIASIHQPSSATFNLFDRVLLLSEGKTCFFGPAEDISAYFAHQGRPIPTQTNTAEFLLDLVNTDFSRDTESSKNVLASVHETWLNSAESKTLSVEINNIDPEKVTNGDVNNKHPSNHSNLYAPFVLLHRNWIKSYRDFLAYGTRIVMYMGLAIMSGTVWLRLDYNQSSIQPFINAIFFGGAFMSFMAVGYVPSIIEDLQTFRKERASGLYGPFAFILANFFIGIPYLFLITVLYSIVTYWLSNFRSSADGFWMYTVWLFLDLMAAEGLVVLVTSVAPIFVVALAVTAFANGLWMCVGGFLVPLGKLNVFWKYVFHYIDYQAYVFQGMMVNQFKKTTYTCNGSQCMYAGDLAGEGKIRGTAVLQAYGYAYSDRNVSEWIGILISIVVVYRILGYMVLIVKRN